MQIFCKRMDKLTFLFLLTIYFAQSNAHFTYNKQNVDDGVHRIKRQSNDNSCTVPNEPANGHITTLGDFTHKSGDQVPNLTVITVKCDANRALSPNNSVIICMNGKWTSEIPKCEKLCAPIKSSPVYDSKCFMNEIPVDCSKPISGTSAQLRCAPFYEDPGQKFYHKRLCIDGTWDISLPNCVPECGTKLVEAQLLIIGGQLSKKNQWPWIVAIYNKNRNEYICGGTLLSEKVILSAAHCFADNDGKSLPAEGYAIGAGKYYREFNHVTDNRAQYSDVEEIHIPSDYLGNAGNYRSDIAIIVLKTPFKIASNLRPVCIDWNDTFEKEQLKAGESGVVLGWGLTSNDGKPSSELKEVQVKYRDYSECLNNIPANFKQYLATGDKMCGGNTNQSEGLVCRGDGGSGYAFKKNDRYYVRGVLSIANNCDSNQYALFTKLSNYKDFIETYITKYRSLP